MSVTLEVTSVRKLGRDMMIVGGTVLDVEPAVIGQILSAPEVGDGSVSLEGSDDEALCPGDQVDAFVDQNAHYDGIPIRELKAQLRMPSDARGREDEYQRLFSVCYESREPHHNSSGAIVIHVSSVEYTLVAPVDNSHCRPAEKSERHNVFCQWVVDTFGHDELCAGSGVVEVAGGQGQISSCLASFEIPSTCVEPEQRDQPANGTALQS